MAEKSDKITFKYVCPSDLRDLYVNGLWGGITRKDEFYIHFYSERGPIPKTATHKLNDRDLPEKEATLEMGGDVVRQVQCTIMMDADMAVALRGWLDNRIDFMNARKQEQAVSVHQGTTTVQ
ncbi:MAG: hypothetical protein NTV58_14540 [Deltaproteobacteria bacterium]|nr:hypothetical protein [Deltaproteobacteria bacterium]